MSNELNANTEVALRSATALKTAEHQLGEANAVVAQRRAVVDAIHAEIQSTQKVVEEYGSRVDEPTQEQMLAEVGARRKVKRLRLDLEPAQAQLDEAQELAAKGQRVAVEA